MATVLITGGAGFIGSHLARSLDSKGHEVRVFDNFSYGERDNLKYIENKIEIIKGDIREYDKLKKAVDGCDFVFHQAAVISVPKSIENPLETNDINVSGTLNVLLASKECGVRRLIYASSCAVYGNNEKLPLKESSQTNPTSPYATSKLISEYYCKLFSDIYNLPSTSLRYFNVYGPKQNRESGYAGVITTFIDALAHDKQPVIYGDGDQTRDFVFVKDVVNANILAMESKKQFSMINIGSGKQITIKQLLEKISVLMGKATKARYTGSRKGDIIHSFADITMAKKILGYEPHYKLEDGLRETIGNFI